VNVWKEPDMTRMVPVRPDGKISLPLINDVPGGRFDPAATGHHGYRQTAHVLTEPQVTVIVTQMNSQRVFVVGEVLRAGAFPLIPWHDRIAGAGERRRILDFCRREKIHVMRLVNGKHVEMPFNYREVLKGDNPDQNIKLEPGDTVVVP